METLTQTLRPTVVFLALCTLLFGFAYPGISTVAIQLLFPQQAEGSLIVKDGKVLGSELIGQNFTEPRYFWSRLSATAPYAYNAGASTGSNLGTANPALLDAVKGRAEALGGKNIPIDLVTASGSGLDPQISLAAAEYQVKRVAAARNMPETKVKSLVEQYTEGRQLGFLGEPGVNVLKLNLALDGKL
jgi:K+-transporting ATPase ATPase C chain